jgi:Ca-activated chloride channel family protein
MKLSHFKFIVVICLLILTGAGFVFSQNKSAKKDDKDMLRPLEIKANLFVLNASGNLASEIKPEEIKIFEDGVEQKITRLTKKEPPLLLGLIMDNTGTMRPKLETVIKAGQIIVANLKPNDEAFVVRFVSSEIIEEKQDWTTDKNALKEALEELYIEGGVSAVVDAVYTSAEKLFQRAKEDHSRRLALVLISDGEDRLSFYNEKQLIDLLKKTQIQVFPLTFVTELSPRGSQKKVEKFVHCLALETGGAAFPLIKQNKKAEGDAEILAALKSIVTELHSQYVVEYVSTNQKRDGQTRKLTVQISDGANGEKRQAYIRESFIVPVDKK